MWQYLAAATAGNVLQGMHSRKTLKAQNQITDIENMIGKANADAANIVRRANNELAAAVGSLNRFKQSIGNQQILRASGQEQAQIQTNLLRAREDLNRGSVEDRLDTAFELGSIAAAVSAAGVGGSSRDVLSNTIKMTGARKQAELSRVSGQVTYDALQYLANTQSDAYLQVQGDLFLDALDHGTSTFIPQAKTPVPSAAQVWFTKGLTTVAKNPQLTQQTVEGFRSTSGSSQQQGAGWYSQVSLKV